MKQLLVGCAVMLFAASISAGSRQSTECKRPAARTASNGEVITLTQTSGFPCRLEFVDIPIELRADDGGLVADFAQAFRGPDGRFYTTSRQSAELSVWDAKGKFVRNVGRKGAGPEEFGSAVHSVMFDKQARLYAGDQTNHRWAILSPAFEFIRTTSAASTGWLAHETAMLDDGTLLSGRSTARPTGMRFSVYDFAKVDGGDATRAEKMGLASTGGPGVVRSFGARTPTASPYGENGRIAYAGGNTFIVTPRDGAGLGYEIQLWRTDGTRIRTIRRDVAWFSKRPYDPKGTPPPEIEVTQYDKSGLAYLSLMSPNNKFRDVANMPDAAARKAAQDQMVDIYIEVIDMNAGVVLASRGPLRPSQMSEAPLEVFAGTRLGYRIGEAADGNATLRVMEYRLLPPR